MQNQAQAVPSIRDAIAATMAKPERRKQPKPGFPVIDDPQLREHVDKQVEASNIEKKAKAEKGFHSIAIADRIRSVMDRDGYAGKFSGTYVVLGNVHRVNCTFANKWKVQDEALLRALLGEAFDSLFERRLTVRLRKEVLENPKLAHRLMSMVGHEFVDFFESEETLVPRDDVDVKQRVYDLMPKGKLKLFRQGASQDAPSIKCTGIR
jgi:hypothetical protein